MDEATYRQQSDQAFAPTDPQGGRSEQPMPGADLQGGQPDMQGGRSEQPMPAANPEVDRSEQRLTTSDLANKSGGQSENGETADRDEGRALFPEADASAFQQRWRDVQAAFVDEPRRAVQDADALVADLMQRLAETFANERSTLEQQWDRSGDVSTEEMRVALQRYRSFFDRLLSA